MVLMQVTHEQVLKEAIRVANEIASWCASFRSAKTEISLFGIPRGGIAPTYLVLSCLGSYSSIHPNLAQGPEEADVFIDDIEDSGATKLKYKERFPNVPFFSLFKGQPGSWLVFPWEGDVQHSAEDIPIRLLQFIGEDKNREGLKDTPRRYLEAWKFWTKGYNKNPKDILATFTADNYNELIFQGNIPVWSTCEHHLAPFWGTADIGYIPNGRIVGLSKLSRLVDIFARRLQVQERLTCQIADGLREILQPKAVGVVLKCRHSCMESRGIEKAGSTTTTIALRGLKSIAARSEFMNLVTNNTKGV